MPLTPKQQMFVNEYLVDLNGTKAAIRAGYGEDGAAVRAHENLKDEEIAAAVQQAMDDRATRLKISQDYVVARLVTNLEKALVDGQGAVANKALELLGKHAGMFGAKLEVGFTPPPQAIEGRRPVGLADVFRLAQDLGIKFAVGVDATGARPALPAAADVLPEPPDGQ